MRPLDYSRSFICHTASFNSVRFWVESRTRISDGDAVTDYYQCASCKSENTFAPKDLFHRDNYDFLPVFGGEDLLIFRRPAGLSENYRQCAKARDVWGPPVLKIREATQVRELAGWDDIQRATMSGLPLTTQTEIHDNQTGLTAIIECPVKTINLGPGRRMFQVDTGPVCYPDLHRRWNPQIECLSLAFVAFNSRSSADFIVEQPTKVMRDGEEICQVYHYSDPFGEEATNRIYGVGLE
jgi:hypothetical protein